MIHPHQIDLSQLSDIEIEKKMLHLNKMYFVTENADVRHQMILLIDSYKLELEARAANKKIQQDSNNDLDNLINVS